MAMEWLASSDRVSIVIPRLAEVLGGHRGAVAFQSIRAGRGARGRA